MTGTRGNWSLVLADLALILFVITAGQAAQSAAQARNAGPTAARHALPAAPGVPQAFYLEEPGAPPFAAWIGAQDPGEAAQVTILSSYRPGDTGTALRRAAELARKAQDLGRAPRILIEPGDGSARAILSYDDPGR